ncbi:MAG TPA: sigma 54-interacting transcriptional regulator, partial [Labilithrix sp.]|nr:sigma 54-interacting transcriptional regulator [Labilithrix sp.]
AGALPVGTFESELFGHVRGAFTDAKSDRDGAFARAHDGTLFLDEIGNMPLSQQAKLLRVLQERVFQPLGASSSQPSSARIVAATNADIEALAKTGQFRADLLYRLNAIHLRLPPLRERREEIRPLAEHFARREADRYGLSVPVLEPDAVALLVAYDWPGNVRELEHAMQRAVLLSAKRGRIDAADIGVRAGSAPPPAPTEDALTLREAEREAIVRALERFPDDRMAAARSLGLSRSAFYRRLTQMGLVRRQR